MDLISSYYDENEILVISAQMAFPEDNSTAIRHGFRL